MIGFIRIILELLFKGSPVLQGWEKRIFNILKNKQECYWFSYIFKDILPYI